MACAEFAACEPKPFQLLHVWEVVKDNPKWMDPKQGRRSRVPAPENYEEQLFHPTQSDPSAEQPTPTPTTSGSKRPMGRDAAKRASKRSTSSSGAASEFATTLQDQFLTKWQDNDDGRSSRYGSYLAWKKEADERATLRHESQLEMERQRHESVLEMERHRSERLFDIEEKKLAIQEKKLNIQEQVVVAESKRVELMYSQEEERILSLYLTNLQGPIRAYYEKRQKGILEKHGAM